MLNDKELLERASYSWREDSIRLILTPSSVAKNTFFYAQEVGYFKTFHPYFTERENLDSFLIVYTLSGTGHLQYENNEYTLCAGQCFYVNCDYHHIYWTCEDSDWEFLWIHFNGSSALGYYKEFAAGGFQIINCRDTEFMKHSLWNIIDIYRKKDRTTEVLTANLIHGLLTELLLQTAGLHEDTFLIPDYIKAMVKEIDQKFKYPLPLSYFEKTYHRSRYYLIREFKKYIGVTIREYIIQARMSYAKELLKYTDTSVNDITFELGFQNVTHFINLFKKREGITPLAYRKAWRG